MPFPVLRDPGVSAYGYKRNQAPQLRALHEMHKMHKIEERMKTADQTRRALAQRAANATAKAAGLPMPFPNPWDALDDKLPEGSSREEHMAWCANFARRYAPRR